jgi:hypothetical protein
MSGWDVDSSTPTWGPRDGHEQAPSANEAVAPGSPEGPPPEFFGSDYGQPEQTDLTPGGFPRRTPGRSLQGLPRRDTQGRHAAALPESYGRDDAFGQDSAPSPETAFGQERSFRAFRPDPGYPQEAAAFGSDTASPQDYAFGAEAAFATDGAFGSDTAFSSDNAFNPEAIPGAETAFSPEAALGLDGGFGTGNGFGQDTADSADSAYVNDSAYRIDSAYGVGWGGGAEDLSRPGPEHPDWSAPALNGDGSGYRYGERAVAEPSASDYGASDYASPDYAARDRAAQDLPGQNYASQNYTQSYATQSYGTPAQDGWADGGQQTAGLSRAEAELAAARMDPALRDFFAPLQGDGLGTGDRWGEGPGGPGGARHAQGSRPQPPRGTGPGTALGDGRGRRGLSTRGYVGAGLVVAVGIVVAVLAFSRGGGASPGATGTQTAASTAPPASEASAVSSSPAASSGPSSGGAPSSGVAATTSYVLSTPSAAGGYAKGSDPNFLSIATSTANGVVGSVASGKAGTVKGSPVAAAYDLPVAGQVVTFVGYQGSFTPAKVAAVLSSLGTDVHSYPAGPHGGILRCANTPSTPTETSGGVCVWASDSTIGVTEFFSSTGPEALTASQGKGATDTVNMRADVEAKS